MKIISNMIEAHIFKNEGGLKFLMLKRSDNVIYPGLWQMVNGKIKEEEKAFSAALREIKEETGLIPAKLWAAPTVNKFYSHESDTMNLVTVFAAEVQKGDQIKLSHEHTEYRWVNLKEAVKLLAWEAQRNSARLIYQYYKKEKIFLDLLEIKL